jgi:hypothetical protein
MTFWVAGAVVVGGALTANAAGAAADSQAASTEAGIAEQRRQYDLTRADQAPYRDVGARSLGRLEIENDWALNPASVQLDPGYEFARQQGQQGIDRKTAAAGGRISGAALKAASQYNTDYATTGYSTAYNRVNQARSDRLNRLAALGNIGQTSTQQTGAAGQNTANAISGMVTAQGNASGAAQIAQGNIWGSTGNQLAALYGRNTTPTNSTSGWGSTGSGFGTGAQYGNQDYGQFL